MGKWDREIYMKEREINRLRNEQLEGENLTPSFVKQMVNEYDNVGYKQLDELVKSFKENPTSDAYKIAQTDVANINFLNPRHNEMKKTVLDHLGVIQDKRESSNKLWSKLAGLDSYTEDPKERPKMAQEVQDQMEGFLFNNLAEALTAGQKLKDFKLETQEQNIFAVVHDQSIGILNEEGVKDDRGFYDIGKIANLLSEGTREQRKHASFDPDNPENLPTISTPRFTSAQAFTILGKVEDYNKQIAYKIAGQEEAAEEQRNNMRIQLYNQLSSQHSEWKTIAKTVVPSSPDDAQFEDLNELYNLINPSMDKAMSAYGKSTDSALPYYDIGAYYDDRVESVVNYARLFKGVKGTGQSSDIDKILDGTSTNNAGQPKIDIIMDPHHSDHPFEMDMFIKNVEAMIKTIDSGDTESAYRAMFHSVVQGLQNTQEMGYQYGYLFDNWAYPTADDDLDGEPSWNFPNSRAIPDPIRSDDLDPLDYKSENKIKWERPQGD